MAHQASATTAGTNTAAVNKGERVRSNGGGRDDGLPHHHQGSKRPRLSSPGVMIGGGGGATDRDEDDDGEGGGGGGVGVDHDGVLSGVGLHSDVVDGGRPGCGGGIGDEGGDTTTTTTGRNMYRGYRLERPDQAIDVIRWRSVEAFAAGKVDGDDERGICEGRRGGSDINDRCRHLTPEAFFRDYVAERRPCLLDFHPPFDGCPRTKGEGNDAGSERKKKRRMDGGLPRRRPQWIITRTILEHTAGDEMVQVERRFHRKESFGQPRTESRQLDMSLRSFLRRVCCSRAPRSTASEADDDGGHGEGEDGADREGKGDVDGELLYLSTQERHDPPARDGDDDESMPLPIPDPIASPCRQLVDAGVIPDRLDLAGNLILHACNLWIGRSANGSSSGLHHDYHDNFYVLIKGRKRFRLYSPDVAERMETFGKIDVVHTNGRISYVGSEARADGAPVDVLRRHRRRDGEDEGERSGRGRRSAVDNGIKSRAPNGDGVDDHSDGDEGDEDDDDDEEEEVVIGRGHDYVSSGSDDEYDGDAVVADGGDDMDHPPPVDDYDRMEEAEAEDEAEVEGEDGEGGTVGAARPDSFSRIDLRRDPDEIASEFPNFAGLDDCVCEVSAGQCLYLPAGWFHEVTSFGGGGCGGGGTGPKDEGANTGAGGEVELTPPNSTATSEVPTTERGEATADDSTGIRRGRSHEGDRGRLDDDDDDDGLDGCHVAVNYWFHPPDDLISFHEPYRDDFWVRAPYR